LPNGLFLIETENRGFYYEYNGSSTGIILDTGSYTGTTLAAMIQTKLHVIDVDWDCTYSNNTFNIHLNNVAGVTSCSLRLSNQSNAVWQTLGFTGTVDIDLYADVDHSVNADEQRIHTYEYLIFDIGYSAPVDFFALIGESGEEITLSENAVVKLQGNSINSFTSPPFDKTITRTIDGYYRFNDDVASSYRYWRIYIEDKTNTLDAIKVSKVYLGDYTEISRNVSHGFTTSIEDLSTVVKSESGIIYADIKKQYSKISGINLNYITVTDKELLESFFLAVGLYNPFFISIDPTLKISTTLNKLTKYCFLESAPVYSHNVYSYYSTTLNVSEVL
jgi:hypothetical protein